MTGPLPIALFSAAAWAGLVLGHVVPADPTITAPAVLPRQNANDFMGWVELNNTWTSLACDPGNTWYQSGDYAQCCPETNQYCNAPTACVEGSQIYPFPSFATTTTIACTDNYNNPAWSICNTIFIFESFGDSNPKTDIVCGEESSNWSFFRKIPASATETSSQPSTRPSSGGSSDSGSKAWIAGAVVGPVVGLALIGLIIFFLRRRKSKKAGLGSAQGGAAMAPLDPSRPPAGVAGYTDAKPHFPTDHQAGYYPPQPIVDPTNPNPHAYPEASTSPAPQYIPPNSPPLPNTYANDTKHGYGAPSHPGAAELGGDHAHAPTMHASPPMTYASPSTTHTAELAGQAPREGDGGAFSTTHNHTLPSELSGTSK